MCVRCFRSCGSVRAATAAALASLCVSIPRVHTGPHMQGATCEELTFFVHQTKCYVCVSVTCVYDTVCDMCVGQYAFKCFVCFCVHLSVGFPFKRVLICRYMGVYAVFLCVCIR